MSRDIREDPLRPSHLCMQGLAWHITGATNESKDTPGTWARGSGAAHHLATPSEYMSSSSSYSAGAGRDPVRALSKTSDRLGWLRSGAREPPPPRFRPRARFSFMRSRWLPSADTPLPMPVPASTTTCGDSGNFWVLQSDRDFYRQASVKRVTSSSRLAQRPLRKSPSQAEEQTRRITWRHHTDLVDHQHCSIEAAPWRLHP